MTLLERQSLLLRQLAGLRRRGLAHDEALRLAMQGLPAGELRHHARRALRALATGDDTGPAPRELVYALLADGQATAAEIEHAAAALEARLWGRQALQTTRLYAAVAVAAPPLLAFLLGWAFLAWPVLLGMEMTDHGMLVESTGGDGLSWFLAAVSRWLGAPLAIAAIVAVLRTSRRFAPGYQGSLQAAGLLELAARGGDRPPLALEPLDQRYFERRREAVGASAAARELAVELGAESRRQQLAFRHLAPLAGALLLLPMIVTAIVVLVLPLFAIASWIA